MTGAADYYRLLEVSPNASIEEIEESYQRIIEYLDADSLAMYSMMESGEIDNRREEVDLAYSTLADPDRRADYDRNRGGGAEPARNNYPDVSVPPSQGVTTSTAENDPVPELLAFFDETPIPNMEPDDRVTTTVDDDEDAVPPIVEPEPQRPAADETAEFVAMPQEATVVDAPIMRGTPEPLSHPPTRTPGAAPKRPALAKKDFVVHEVGYQPPEDSKVRRRVRHSVSRQPALRPTSDFSITPDTEFSGSLLARLRESSGASVEDVARRTKINKRYIKALEANDFDSLPAAVYVRGFITEYARCLGLPTQQVAKSFMSLYDRYRAGE